MSFRAQRGISNFHLAIVAVFAAVFVCLFRRLYLITAALRRASSPLEKLEIPLFAPLARRCARNDRVFYGRQRLLLCG
jgi:hypothetical protein